MSTKDSVQTFLFEHAPVRGAIVRLEQTSQTILSQRPYPKRVKQLLNEALMACALLAQSIKFEGSLHLQFQGDARLPLILVQCDHQLQIRAFAQYGEGCADEDYAEAFLQGQMALTIDQNKQSQNYQSLVPIQSTSMSDNLMTYFAQSEQISTKVWLAVNGHQAAGMLLQLMPGQASLQREQFWEYAVQLGQTVRDEELLQLDNETLLYRLYNETDLRLFTPRPVTFRCRCSKEKMKQVLTVLGQQETEDLLKEQSVIDIRCDFCNQHYAFDAIDVSLLFHQSH